MSYFVYMVECADGTYYTGITTDVSRRVGEHNEGNKGAKYTKARRPVELVYVEEVAAGRGAAAAREYAVRTLSRQEKNNLSSSCDLDQFLAGK